MKKILFATTALVATAGIASADIGITGSAEIGIFGGSGVNDQFHTDIDVTFAGTGTADNGLTFGGSVDLDEGGSGAAAHANDADDGGASFFVAFGGARLDMGDTDGAFDAVMQEVNIAGGSIGDNEEHGAFSGNSGLDGTGGGDGQIARFSYTFDAFTGHLSVEQAGNGAGQPIYGLGVRYSGDLAGLTLGVGLGYQTQDGGETVTGISIDTTLANGLGVAINYSENDGAAGPTRTHTGIGIGYTMNQLAVGVNYGEMDNGAGATTTGYGIAASYDLGGGLSARAGYGSSETANVTTDSYSLGLAMSF